MIVIGIAVAVIGSFSLGFLLNQLIWRARIRNTEFMKRAIENARIQGRLDRRASYNRGIEPPSDFERTDWR